MSAHFDNVVKITPIQLDTLNNGGSVSGHTSNLNSMYLEGLEDWSSYVSIVTNGTNISLKDKNFYHFQVTSEQAGNVYLDFGITCLDYSNSNGYLIAGTVTNNGLYYRLTFYHITSNLWAVYIYVNTSSGISTLTATGGYKLRYKKVNL